MLARIFQLLKANSRCRIIPASLKVAQEVAKLGALRRHPADRTIVACARIHGLTLLTSGELIASSRLVSVVD